MFSRSVWRLSCAVCIWPCHEDCIQLPSALYSCLLWHCTRNSLCLGPAQSLTWCRHFNKHTTQWLPTYLLITNIYLFTHSGESHCPAVSHRTSWNTLGFNGFRFPDLASPEYFPSGLSWRCWWHWAWFCNWDKVRKMRGLGYIIVLIFHSDLRYTCLFEHKLNLAKIDRNTQFFISRPNVDMNNK